MKYMVMECHFSYAVVLSEEGQFLKVANRNYQVGQKVSDIIEMQLPETAAGKKRSYKWIYSLAAAAACMILVMTSVFRMDNTAYASVYMAINPEVRIDVNKGDRVVGLAGMNPDGETLIQSYNYKRKPLDLVMDELIDLAIDQGYLHQGGQIMISLDAEDNTWVTDRGDTLSTHLHQRLTEKISITIEITDKTAWDNRIMIPINGGNDSYGESDYGESDYGLKWEIPIEPAPGMPAEPEQEKFIEFEGQILPDTEYGHKDVDDGGSEYKQENSSAYGENGSSGYGREDGDSEYESDDD